jgi:histone H3/H4
MTNDMMMMPPPPMPPSKPQELAAPPVVEPTKCIEPTNEEMKESKEHATTMEENEERESAPEKCTDDLGSAVQQLPAPPPRLCRPIQKARTAYFIFADEKRAEIAARHPGEGVGAVARETGQMWAALTEEEKARYHQQSAQEKERVAAELEEAYNNNYLPDDSAALTTTTRNPATVHSSSSLQLPSARIRKICKLDPDVKGISKEALLLITKSAEVFTKRLGSETVRVAALQNRRKLLPQDLASVCSAREQFVFLKEDVRDWQHEMHRQQQQQARLAKTTKQHKSDDTDNATNHNNKKDAKNEKPLTDYFSAKQPQ